MSKKIISGRSLFLVAVLLAAAGLFVNYQGNPGNSNGSIPTADAQETLKPEAATSRPAESQAPSDLSVSEIALLQELSARRQELDARESGFDTRERLLAETEKRIDEKIAKLAALEQEILSVVEVQEEKDSEKLKSLVRVYERMRPRDAARIIEGLEASLQLDVASRMRAIKLAAILSVMDPAVARELTNRMASQAQLPAADG